MTLGKFLDLSPPRTPLLIIPESWGAFSGIPCVWCFLTSGHAVSACRVVSAVAIPSVSLPFSFLLCPVLGQPFQCDLFIFYAAGPTRIDWVSLGVQLVQAGCGARLGAGERAYFVDWRKPQSPGELLALQFRTFGRSCLLKQPRAISVWSALPRAPF